MIRVPLRLKITRIDAPEIKVRQLNTIIREALRQAAEYWIENYLPKHFEPGAYQRYQYAARTSLYSRIKNRATRVRPWIGRTRGGWIKAPKPVRPWVWSGNTMYGLLTKRPNEFNVRPVATSKKQTVTVKLPAPHAVSPAHAGELGRLNNEEFAKMHKIAFEYVKAELARIKSIQTSTFTW